MSPIEDRLIETSSPPHPSRVTTSRRHRTERGAPPRWRRVRRIVVFAACICLVPAGVSYLSAMREKHNVGLGVSSVEWLRQHGGNSLVSEIENAYYSLNAPAKGGPPLTTLPRVGVAGTGAESRPAAGAYRPPDVKPLIHPALPGEGVWKKAGAGVGPQPPVLLDDLSQRPRIPTVRRRRRLGQLGPDQARIRPGTRRATRTTAQPWSGRGAARKPRARGRHLQWRLPAGNLEFGPDLSRQGRRSDGQRDRDGGRVPRRPHRHRALGPGERRAA